MELRRWRVSRDSKSMLQTALLNVNHPFKCKASSSLAEYAMWTNPLVPGSLTLWISSICINNSSACTIYTITKELGICLNLCFLSFANYPKVLFLFMVLNSRFRVWNMWKGCTLLILFERANDTHSKHSVLKQHCAKRLTGKVSYTSA